MAVDRRATRTLALALATLVGAACATTSDAPEAPEAPDACAGAPAIPAGQPFTLAGHVTYDLVPARYDRSTGSGGLDFDGASPAPVRSAVVEVRQCGNVLATTTTDDAGHYAASSTSTPAAVGQIAVYVLARTVSPPITVRDGAGATWAVGARIAGATGTLDVHAPHGWTGTSYGRDRIAAPFAILDTMLTADRALLAVRDVPFATAPLTVNWSPSSTTGSHYDPWTREVSLAGVDGVDTDEFDRGVVAHEWAHWFEDRFSRSDSPGGYHTFGSVLDPRVAFDEGSASALSAVVLGDPLYVDTSWTALAAAAAQDAFGWSAETASPTDDLVPGPFSEMSILRAVYDLYDGGSSEAYDAVALGAGPIYDALVGPQRTTPALTTVASFVSGLKAQPGVDAAAVDALLAHYRIGAITSEWGDGDASLRPLYDFIGPPSATAATYTATFEGGVPDCNEKVQNQFYRFTAAGAQVTVEARSAYDVDLAAYDAGLFRIEASPSASESMTFATRPGQVYVVVLSGCATIPGTYTATARFTAP